ncbi:MAG: hypothetical protein BMS9Abin26_1625 [Gammaproteobacteria bacterium]|nr:MAG: hypothetical protein BMS9Abin26_1625 [Gammaproteobacteria bacterium]
MDTLGIITLSIATAAMVAGVKSEAVAETLELSGFVQAHVATRTSDVDCPVGTECDVPFNDQRVQLKAEANNEAGSLAFLGKVDLIHDQVLEENKAEVRELYADYNADSFTVRGGRQIITWGVGDLLFINDIFPKDWVAFYSGLPMEYLKRGSDAAKLDLYLGSTTLEVVVSDFRADRLPDSRQFVMASPFSPSLPRNIDEPAGQEIALKYSGNLGGWDSAVYASRGYYRAPALTETATEVHGSYARLNTLGASLSGAFANGVLNLEAGYYDSEDDRSGDNPTIENSQARFLIGYSRQVGQETQIGAQAYAEWMQDHNAYQRTLPSGFSPRDEVRTVATLRFTQRYLHQTLTFNLFAFWGLSEDDTYIIPSARYAFSDDLWAELGANIFSGSRSGMFGAMGDNDNVYLSVRYAF